MPKISELTPERGRMFMFKGEFKTGKTVAYGSFPEPIYIFDCDGRMAPLASCPWLKGKDIEYDTYTDWNKITKKLEEFEHRCDFATVVMGSLTSLARCTINSLFRNRGTGSSGRKGDKAEPLSIGGIPIMGIAEYNGESSGLNIIMTQMRVIHNIHKCNMILECHVVTGEIPQLGGGATTFRRIVTGGNKVAAEIPGYFDEVYHFYCDSDINSEKREFVARIRSNSIDFAGSAIPELPDKINHTNEDFYKIWSGYLPKDSAKTTLNTENEFNSFQG